MTLKRHILVVDDEEEICQLVEYHLLKAGYACTCADSGRAALAAAGSAALDLIVLDLMLPGMDGFQVCSSLKANPKTCRIPVVMLTAKGTEQDIVRGLEAGADDYVTKPFSPAVLLARMAAILRRSPKNSRDAEVIQVGEVTIHVGRHEVTVKGAQLDLTHTEFGLIHYLAQRPGWVFTRSQIVDVLRGPGYPVTDRAVDVQVAGLRKKLGEYGEYIETIRGVGYRFKE